MCKKCSNTKLPIFEKYESKFILPLSKVLKSKIQEITLYNLKGNQGLSDFTQKTRKQRNQIMGGGESKTAQLTDVKINRKKDWVTFTFITPVTQGYPDDHVYKRVKPPSMELVKNSTGFYEVKIRILDFFKWLDTTPTEITNKDIEDVLRVADVELFSSDPSFTYQGLSYYLDQVYDATIYPATIPPTNTKSSNGEVIGWKAKHNAGDGIVSKHLGGIINSIDFFIPQMRQMLVKKIKKK